MLIKLIRTDIENPQKISLPLGSHMIGRGENILDCTDKRISRNHANLKVTSDELILKSLHQNPCYFVKKNVPATQILKQNFESNLYHGDRFGLLPESYWYEVLFCADIEDDSPPAIPSEGNIEKLDDNNTENCSQNDDKSNFSMNESAGDNLLSEPQSLPNVTSPMVNYEPCNPIHYSSTGTSNADIQSNQVNITDNSRDLEDQASTTSKRSHSDIENDVKEKKVKIDDKPKIIPGCSYQAGDNASPKVKTNPKGRERCIYGASCYRRNPQHLATFSHPSDADWGVGQRGQCPWGLSCCRTDPRHWLHHDHPPGTVPPPAPPPNQPGRATKRIKTKLTKKKKDSDVDSDDESLSEAQNLMVIGKRQRKPVILQIDWNASDDDGDDDPYQTDESDEWQPSGSTQRQSQEFSQDYD